MEIRELSLSELKEASDLIREVFWGTEARECREFGVNSFLDSISADCFILLIRDEGYVLYGLFLDKVGLTGVLGARGNFLALLFIRQEHKRKGYGGKLFAYYKERISSGEERYERITTNSSVNAQIFYEKLGFSVVGEKVEIFGIPYIPMMMLI